MTNAQCPIARFSAKTLLHRRCVSGFLRPERAAVQHYAQPALSLFQRKAPGSLELFALWDSGAEGLRANYGRSRGGEDDALPGIIGAIGRELFHRPDPEPRFERRATDQSHRDGVRV